MKKLILLLLFIPLVFCCTPSDHDDSELKPFYLDTNGVTIKARDWVTWKSFYYISYRIII